MPSTNIIFSELANKGAVFTCKYEIVTVQFVNDTTTLGEPRSFTRGEAFQFGRGVLETGNWKDFPFTGIETATVRDLGGRLRDFAISANREGATSSLQSWPIRSRLSS
jgi:hypothetical protein